ncbi:MAG: response regulator [Armatimonadota bacterium]|nr:MAG: response regulator [Armatimonadota bacterium]
MSDERAVKKILIVDDDRASRVLMRTMLQSLAEPCHISEAIGGQQALRIIEANQPDIVLLDVLMPDMDGVSLCDTIKRTLETRQTKILMVTARRDERMIRAGLLAGADDYITKPFTQDQFLGAVQRLMTA